MNQKRRTRHQAGPTDVLGRGQHIKGFNCDYSNILRIPTKPKKSCIGCGIRFAPIKHWHRLCPTCWDWHRAGRHLELAARLLKRVR